MWKAINVRVRVWLHVEAENKLPKVKLARNLQAMAKKRRFSESCTTLSDMLPDLKRLVKTISLSTRAAVGIGRSVT